jgi:hypothetical protein
VTDYRWEQAQSMLMQRHLTRAGNKVQLPVPLNATSLAVAANVPEQTDANYGVQATPNWNTAVWITSKTKTGYTVNFGTMAPANAVIDCLTFRSE